MCSIVEICGLLGKNYLYNNLMILFLFGIIIV